jgi:hypothetical protein
VFTLPAVIGAIAYQNKAKVYGLLFTAAAETLTTIAADPKHLGAAIGLQDDKALHTALDLIRGIQKNSAFPPNPKTAVPN